jgi:hypothetical protein
MYQKGVAAGVAVQANLNYERSDETPIPPVLDTPHT